MPGPSERVEFARKLRRESTDAERILWERLRRRQIAGLKFRRQVPIGRYVVDFLCLQARLVVEVDDVGHADRFEYDRQRTHYMNACGYEVLRFWNGDVLGKPEEAIDAIHDWLNARHNPTCLSGHPSRQAIRPAERGGT